NSRVIRMVPLMPIVGIISSGPQQQLNEGVPVGISARQDRYGQSRQQLSAAVVPDRGDASPRIPEYGPAVDGLFITAPSGDLTVHSGDSIQVSVIAINEFVPTSVLITTPFDSKAVDQP